jgi:hypothetical protein
MEELNLINNNRLPEIHTIIIWNGKIDSKVIKKKLNLCNISKEKFNILFNKVIFLNKEEQIKLINSIYIKNKIKINKIINNSIRLIILKDLNPLYSFTSSTTCMQVLNNNMKVIKNKLRQLIGGNNLNFRSVHTSYNIEESLLVLEPLKLNKFIFREKFKNLNEFLYKINNDKYLKYVILFDYNIINKKSELFNNNNIKFLVNDYYYFKSLVGARSTDKINMRENDNGYNINNMIIIDNKIVSINIRFIGDNYFDSNWQKNILNSANIINLNNYKIKITNNYNQYFTLLYHIIIHKNFIYNKKTDYIKNRIIKVPFDKMLLTKKLKDFMNKKKYKIERPIDKFVKFYNDLIL